MKIRKKSFLRFRSYNWVNFQRPLIIFYCFPYARRKTVWSNINLLIHVVSHNFPWCMVLCWLAGWLAGCLSVCLSVCPSVLIRTQLLLHFEYFSDANLSMQGVVISYLDSAVLCFTFIIIVTKPKFKLMHSCNKTNTLDSISVNSHSQDTTVLPSRQ
jgi:hypothetical protein